MLKKLLKWLRDPEITILSNEMLDVNERGRTARFRYQSRVTKVARALEGKKLTFYQILEILVKMKALPEGKWGEHRLGLLMDLGISSGYGERYNFLDVGENEEGKTLYKLTLWHNKRF